MYNLLVAIAKDKELCRNSRQIYFNYDIGCQSNAIMYNGMNQNLYYFILKLGNSKT